MLTKRRTVVPTVCCMSTAETAVLRWETSERLEDDAALRIDRRHLSVESLHQTQKRACNCLIVANGSFPWSHDDIQAGRQFVLLQSKRLPDSPLPTIANNRVADFAADRQTKPRIRTVASSPNHQNLVRGKVIFVVDARIIFA